MTPQDRVFTQGVCADERQQLEFERKLEHCPSCGGALKIVAPILEVSAVERILTHLSLQAQRSDTPWAA